MSYNPIVKVYYISEGDSGPDETNRLVPAPLLSINQELIYANDIVIGYTPIISLNGNCTSLDLRNITPGNVYDFNDTIVAIKNFKEIISANGGTLLVTDANGKELLKATGGIVRSISIEESENKWVNYAPYSLDIEFNELWLGDCDALITKNCGEIFDGLTETPELLNMKKYRVKSFKDSFSLELSEDTMYNAFLLDNLNINNQHFNIKYTIDATGKHYFNSDFQLMPAWEQAKKFVQFKLIEQIKNRLISQFMQRYTTGCDDPQTKVLEELYESNSPGLFDNITLNDFQIFNETVSCDASEAEGSFSATYSAIIKRKHAGSANNQGVLHFFNKSINTTDDGSVKNVTITFSGEVRGLIETGLIKTPNIIELPASGSIFVYNDNATDSRYSKALAGLTDIVDTANEDIKSNIKTALGITNSALGVTGNCINASGVPSPASYNLNHTYVDGVITYETTYTTERACSPSGTSFTNINITVEDSVDIVAEFVIPGRSKGPIIQKIGAKNPKKININIDGSVGQKCCLTTNIDDLYDEACAGFVLPDGIPPAALAGAKLTQDQFVVNPLDGSYSISRSYTICCV